MTARARRRAPVRHGPSPEWMAAGLAVAVYGLALLAGPLLATVGPGGPARDPAVVPPAATASPSPSIDPLRGHVNAILEIDARLMADREELVAILDRVPFRSSEVAFVLRRVKTTLLPAAERVGRLAQHPSAAEYAAQLELLYASASATVDRASDLALGADVGYREAAQDIIDLFRDLPAIDAGLRALLEPGAVPTLVPTGSGAPSGSPASASPVPPAATLPPAASPRTSGPGERLSDPGFETGLGPWSVRTAAGTAAPVVGAGPALGTVGSRSLRVDVAPTASIVDVSIGQGPIALKAGARYIATVAVRASVDRQVQLRIVGPAEEPYGFALGAAGPEVTVVRLEFVAIADQPEALLWIDVGGPAGAIVFLDDASVVEQAAG